MKRLLSAACIVAIITLSAGPASAKTKVPPSCLRALNQAETVVVLTSDFVNGVVDFLNTLSVAAQESYSPTDFITKLTTAVTDLGSTTRDVNSRVLPQVARYKRSAAKCRNAG